MELRLNERELRGGTTAEGELFIGCLDAFLRSFKYRVLQFLTKCGNADIELMTPFKKGRLLNIYRSEITQQAIRSVIYLMGACLFHLQSLVHWYSGSCKRYASAPVFPGSTRAVTTDETPYFQFEALRTTVMRGYNALRYAIWKNGVVAEVPQIYSNGQSNE